MLSSIYYEIVKELDIEIEIHDGKTLLEDGHAYLRDPIDTKQSLTLLESILTTSK